MFEGDYSKKVEEITKWIRETVSEAGFSRVIVAVSGGIDSAVSLYLLVKALGAENVYALLMPYGPLSTKSLKDGKMVASAVGLERDHVVVRDITKVVDKMIKQINDEKISAIRKGNIMARMRMIFLYDLAKSLNALVVGTENKSEYYLGYFTRFGDEASDIEPIRQLYKTQVWEMARYLGVSQEIIKKAPSANLWEGQSDEREFGFSYEDADKVLYHYFEEGLPRQSIVALGLSQKLVDGVLQFVEKNNFKHHVPFIIK